jgi:large subunit ribosomal protein L7Ae
MPRSKKTVKPAAKKAAAPASSALKKTAGGAKKAGVKKESPLIEKRARNFGIGGAIQPTRNLVRYVKWPRYIRVQRQRAVLLKRLKVPPVINQFSRTLDKNGATQLFKLLHNHKPETPAQKKQRLLAAATAKDGGQKETKKPNVVKFGIKHVTALVEQKKAKLVVIAHDVDPIDVVLWLPTLCKKKGVPYCIIKSKARLGQVVGTKTATCLAFVNVDAKDKADFANLVSLAQEQYNNVYEKTMKTRGGLQMPAKNIQRHAKRARDARKIQKK